MATDKDFIIKNGLQVQGGDLDVTGTIDVTGASNNVRIGTDTGKFLAGASNDLKMFHDGTNSVITHDGDGNLVIRVTTDDADLKLQSDDGSGGQTDYLRLDGDLVKTVFVKDTRHNDNVKATFGTSSDLEIYHDESNSFIKDNGIGQLYLLGGSGIVMQNPSQTETFLTATVNNKVELYYDNSPKFETTSAGVEVTGRVNTDTAFIGTGTTSNISHGALVINHSTLPQVLFDGGGDTNLDIAVPAGEILQIGHWNTSTSSATLRLSMETDGTFSFEGNPIQGVGGLTVNGDISLPDGGSTINFGATGNGGPHGLNFTDDDGSTIFRVLYRTTPQTLTFENAGETAQHTFDLSGNYTAVGTITSSSGTSSFNATDIAQIEIGDGGTNATTDASNIGSKANYLLLQRDEALPIEIWGSNIQSRKTHYFGGGDTDAEANIDTSGNFTTSGTVTINSAGAKNALTLSGTSPTIALTDTTVGHDNFWIHVNTNKFYILPDRDGSTGAYGQWETPYALELDSSTNVGQCFGNDILVDGANISVGTISSGVVDVIVSNDVSGLIVSTLGDGGGASNTGLAIVPYASGGILRTVGTNRNMLLQIGTSTALTIDSTRDVLINNTSFDVGGVLNVSNSNDNSNVNLIVAESERTGIVGAGLVLHHKSTSPAANDYNFITFSGKDAGAANTSYAEIRGLIDATNAGAEQGNLAFLVANAGSLTERMRIDHSGNVGIGEINPSSRLEVNGTITIGTGTGTYQAGALGYTDSNWGFLYRPPQAGALGAHLFEATDGTDLLTIEESGNATFAGTVTVNGNNILMDAIQSRVKYSVWDNNTYGIGMQSNYTFGGLANDFAMTFQMNDSDGRGFWWGDSTHTKAQGAMALTTNGRLTVARSVRVGYGETDTTTPSSALDVSGAITSSGNIVSNENSGITINTADATYAKIKQDYSSVDILELTSFGSMQFSIDSNNNSTNKYFIWNDGGEGTGGTELMSLSDGGVLSMGPSGSIAIDGTTIIDSNDNIVNFNNIISGASTDHKDYVVGGTATPYLWLDVRDYAHPKGHYADSAFIIGSKSGEDHEVSPYVDNVNLFVDGTLVHSNMQAGTTYTISASDLSAFSRVTADGPIAIYCATNINSATMNERLASRVLGSFANRSFPIDIFVYAPYASCTLNFFRSSSSTVDTSGTPDYTTTLTKGQGFQFQEDVHIGSSGSGNQYYVITADADIIAEWCPASGDRMLMPPASMEFIMKGATASFTWTDGTTSGSITTITGSGTNYFRENSGKMGGWAVAIADGAGGDAEYALGLEWLSDHYVYPNVSFTNFRAVFYQDTEFKVLDSSNNVLYTESITADKSGPVIKEQGAASGAGADLSTAGPFRFVGTKPFHIVVQEGTGDDECVLLGALNDELARHQRFDGGSINNNIRLDDSIQLMVGSGNDGRFYHDGNDTFLTNQNDSTTLRIRQAGNDQDVLIESDNGSGGITTYFRADGSTGQADLFHYGSEKFSTLSSGVNVTGDLHIDGFQAASYNSNVLFFGDHGDDLEVDIQGFSEGSRIYMGDGSIYMYGNSNGTAEFLFTSSGALHADGNITAYSTTTGSDIKLKNNISTIDNSLDTILNLRGVDFTWKRDNKKAKGFIAQEVEKVLPELVDEAPTLGSDDETHKTVDYQGIIPILVEAIKEQQKQIDELKKVAHPKCGIESFDGYNELIKRIEELEK